MARSFARTLQAHRLDPVSVWVALLAGACVMALAWTWWAFSAHGDVVIAKAPAKRAGDPAATKAATKRADGAAESKAPAKRAGAAR